MQPWIGSKYESSDAPKTLILGESHYGDSHIKWNYPFEQKTILCIQQQIDNTWKGRFYTRIASTFIGYRPSVIEKGVFWNSVAYHNLITEPLQGARRAPTQEQWNVAIETLPEIIERLEPDYCVTLGFRMWHQLKGKFDFNDFHVNSDIGPCGAFISERMNCIFHGLRHPSGRGYRNAENHQFIANLKKEIWG